MVPAVHVRFDASVLGVIPLPIQNIADSRQPLSFVLMIAWNIYLWKGNAKKKCSAVYLVATAVDRDSDVRSYSCLHHSLNGYIFLCLSSLTCQKENIIINLVLGVFLHLT